MRMSRLDLSRERQISPDEIQGLIRLPQIGLIRLRSSIGGFALLAGRELRATKITLCNSAHAKSAGSFYTRDPSKEAEDHMSARNGQRARFHRNRKRRVIRLMRLRTVMAELLKKKAAGKS